MIKTTEYAKRILQSWAATRARTNTGREIDALLTPYIVWPACQKYRFSYDNYTSLWNVLAYCVSTVPVTFVSQEQETKHEYEGRNATEMKIWNDFSPAALSGAPVGVQLVGRRWNEEHLLKATRVCDNALRACGNA